MPIWLASQVEPALDGVVHTGARLVGFRRQLHASILQGLVALAVIARLATGYDIRPLMPTTATPRHHMVDRQVVLDDSAILTREAITDEYLAATELYAWSGPTHKCPQSYD